MRGQTLHRHRHAAQPQPWPDDARRDQREQPYLPRAPRASGAPSAPRTARPTSIHRTGGSARTRCEPDARSRQRAENDDDQQRGRIMASTNVRAVHGGGLPGASDRSDDGEGAQPHGAREIAAPTCSPPMWLTFETIQRSRRGHRTGAAPGGSEDRVEEVLLADKHGKSEVHEHEIRQARQGAPVGHPQSPRSR